MELPIEIQEAMTSGRYEDVADRLERLELEDPPAFEAPHWPRALHMLTLIYANRLEDARFVYKRTPELRQDDADVQKAFALLQRLWVRDYQRQWAALQGEWGPQLQPVVAGISRRLRQRMLDLVARAYVDLSPAKLSVLMGLPEQEAAQVALDQGWEVDAPTGMIIVKPRPEAQAALPTQEQLQRLAEYVVHLES